MGRVLRSRIIQDKESTPQQITDVKKKIDKRKKPRRRIKIIANKNISPESTHVFEKLQETSNQHVNDLETMNNDLSNITDTTDDYQQENIHEFQSKAIVPNMDNDDIIDLTNITINDNAQSSSQLVPSKITNDIIIDITDVTVCEKNNNQNTSPFNETSCDTDTDTDVKIIKCSSNVEQVKTKIETILLDSSDEEYTIHQQPIQKQIIDSKPIKKSLVVPEVKSKPAFSTNTKKRKYNSPLYSRKKTKIDEFMPEILTGNLKGFIVDKQKINHHSYNFQSIGYNATFPQKHERLSAESSITKKKLRPIIIDGLNIGHAHGLNGKFSAKGIDLCVKYFANRGHTEITAFIPQHRQGPPGSKSNKILNELNKKKHICFTPSRKVQNERMTCYDDRILLDYAHRCGGVVVSNDNYRDLYNESDAFKDVIENRQVMVTFVRDEILVPEDQYNRRAAVRSLSEILSFP